MINNDMSVQLSPYHVKQKKVLCPIPERALVVNRCVAHISSSSGIGVRFSSVKVLAARDFWDGFDADDGTILIGAPSAMADVVTGDHS